MVSAGDFRNGVTFEMDGDVYQIIEFQHVKPGKGAAFVRTKIRNVIAGSVVERTFNPTEKFPTAYIERKEMEYSYNDGDLYYFMDPESYELIPINKSDLSDNFKFVKENTVCKILSYKGNVFGVEPPQALLSKSPRPTPASRATPRQTPPSPQCLRPAQRSRFLCSSKRARWSSLTPAPASI